MKNKYFTILTLLILLPQASILVAQNEGIELQTRENNPQEDAHQTEDMLRQKSISLTRSISDRTLNAYKQLHTCCFEQYIPKYSCYTNFIICCGCRSYAITSNDSYIHKAYKDLWTTGKDIMYICLCCNKKENICKRIIDKWEKNHTLSTIFLSLQLVGIGVANQFRLFTRERFSIEGKLCINNLLENINPTDELISGGLVPYTQTQVDDFWQQSIAYDRFHRYIYNQSKNTYDGWPSPFLCTTRTNTTLSLNAQISTTCQRELCVYNTLGKLGQQALGKSKFKNTMRKVLDRKFLERQIKQCVNTEAFCGTETVSQEETTTEIETNEVQLVSLQYEKPNSAALLNATGLSGNITTQFLQFANLTKSTYEDTSDLVSKKFSKLINDLLIAYQIAQATFSYAFGCCIISRPCGIGPIYVSTSESLINKLRTHLSTIQYWQWMLIVIAASYLQAEFGIIKPEFSWVNIKKFGINVDPMVRVIKGISVNLCPVQEYPKYIEVISNITKVCNKLTQTNTYLKQIIDQADYYQQVEPTFNCTTGSPPSTYYNLYGPIRENLSEWRQLQNATSKPCDMAAAIEYVFTSYQVNFKNLGVPLLSTILIPIVMPSCVISFMKSYCKRPFAIERGNVQAPEDWEPEGLEIKLSPKQKMHPDVIDLEVGIKDNKTERERSSTVTGGFPLMENVVERSSRCACFCWSSLLTCLCWNLWN